MRERVEREFFFFEELAVFRGQPLFLELKLSQQDGAINKFKATPTVALEISPAALKKEDDTTPSS